MCLVFLMFLPCTEIVDKVLTKVHTVLTKVHSFYNAFCNKMILFEFKNIQQVFKM